MRQEGFNEGVELVLKQRKYKYNINFVVICLKYVCVSLGDLLGTMYSRVLLILVPNFISLLYFGTPDEVECSSIDTNS